MPINKQVADMHAAKGFSALESDEQQRKWSDSRWKNAMEKGNYDRTRAHLNFEITRDGRIVPIDTSTRIGVRIKQRFKELGLKDPNVGIDPPRYRICAKFIFGGSRERMHQLAFGDQKVDFTHGADNSHITRNPDIEAWALDIYHYCANKWGADNIVGFYCHLDELNPHVHCTIMPITREGKLSYKSVFAGQTKWDYRDRMIEIHNELSEVNRKWNLERGESIAVTGARHKSTEEYRRELQADCSSLETEIDNSKKILLSLNRDIKKAEIRLKGLSTMIGNLEKKKEQLLLQKAQLETELKEGRINVQEAKDKAHDLSIQLDEVNRSLEDKLQKLDHASEQLDNLKDELAVAMDNQEVLRKEGESAVKDIEEQIRLRLFSAALPEVLSSFKEQSKYLSFRDIDIFEDSLLKDLAENGDKILKCAMFLFIGYIDQATEIAQGSGGGGGGSDLKWGRDKDEDEREWARRCMMMAHKLVKSAPTGRKTRR